MIPSAGFSAAWEKHLSEFGEVAFSGDWEGDWGQLQHRRLEVEKKGPEIEPCDPLVMKYGDGANVLCGLFIPVSSKVMDAMPEMRIVGVSRAGLENVNVDEATKRGILVFNVMGRNAHAVSDFAVGMMIAECRNIARAHNAIKNGEWRKTFANNGFIPELHGKTVGLVGFGYIGSLVAKKLSGFDTNVIVYDPYTDPERIIASGCTPVGLEELFQNADFVSLHARLTDENKGMINAKLLGMMKPTAYIINTGRAGLVDQNALAEVLEKKKIMGAALDVFTTEPIEQDSPFLKLDNVTLTTHIAGTTSDALSNSPYLLMEDIATFLSGGQAKFIVNKEVLNNAQFRTWFEAVRG
ncbi:MAG: 2-hydroxyacid dehydrogenase [Oscillospiraceae bacterium]